MNYQEQLKKYLEDLASSKPAPGGGSASALVGALAASLTCMVVNFTVGRERFREFEEEMKKILQEAEKIKDALLKLVDEDVEAYASYVQAKNLPKNTPEEKEKRRKAIEEAMITATRIPLNIMEKDLRILELDRSLLGRSNPYLLSDIKVSAELACASLNSAYFNVKINLPYLRNKMQEETERKGKLFQEKAYFLCKEILSSQALKR